MALEQEVIKTVDFIRNLAGNQNRLVDNPSDSRLKELCMKEPEVKLTKYSHIAAESEPNSRSAKFTKNNIDTQFGNEEADLIRRLENAYHDEIVVSADFKVGNEDENITARLTVPERYAHVVYGAKRLLPMVNQVYNPTHQIIMFFDESFESNKEKKLPDKDITVRLFHYPDGRSIKVVRNSNYFGEFKKGVFAGEDYRVKLSGDRIFLHTGCRQDYLEMAHGGYELQNSLFIALSANGKTSTTCKVIARKGKEKSWLIQDDGGTLTKDGSFKGFEGGGIFVKTEKVGPENQMETYYGLLRPDTFMENVHIDIDEEPDFFNLEKTANGRAVIRRADFMHAGKDISVDRVDNLFSITRGVTIPAISKLTPEQATAFMILGQAEESSAGDPTQAGKIINEFFYDPFIAGNLVDHAHLFYEILLANPHIKCYLLNTGGVGIGNAYQDIRLEDTMGILDSTIRAGLEDWIESEGTGLMVPKSIRTVSSDLLHPVKFFKKGEFEKRQKALDEHRRQTIEQYPGLDKRIRSVFIN